MLAAHFGLGRPYRFERIAVAAIALSLLAAVVAAAAWLWSVGALRAGPRAIYFLYLALLYGAALALARRPRIAAALLVLAAVDLACGVGSRGWARSLLPPLVSEAPRFRWHPLLQAVPISSLQAVNAAGLAIHHTSEGTRGRNPARHALDSRIVVATYGGSTTYDIAVGEGDTWSDRLHDLLGRELTFVVNNGVPGYTTVEHVVQTALYQRKFGHLPRCAVYYVGWADLRNAYIPRLDPGYADFHLQDQIESLKVRRLGGVDASGSPVLTVLARIVSAAVDTVPYVSPPSGPPGKGGDPALGALFERNVRTISAINRQRGVATVWIGPVVNRAAFAGEASTGGLPLVRDGEVPGLLDSLNEQLMHAAAVLGDTGVAVPPQSFGAADFVDNVHFSVGGARRFAETIAPAVREACH